MSNLRNPVSNLANIAIKHNMRCLQRNSKELATGTANNERNLTGYIIGSSLRSSEAVLREVHSSSSYGVNLLHVAQNTIISIKDMLLDMKTIIAQANTSFGSNLKQLDDIYQEKANKILDMLALTKFEGRALFDGSFANFGVQIPAQLIPSSASPLHIRVGEDIQNIISLVIPRLLNGDGTTPDISTPGRFTPLFPMTNNAVDTIAATNLVINSPVVVGAIQMRNNISNNIPDTFGLNPIQDAIRRSSLNAVDALIAQGNYGNVIILSTATIAALRQSGSSADAINTLQLLCNVAVPPMIESPLRVNLYLQNWLAVNPNPNAISAKIVAVAKNALIAAQAAGALNTTADVYQIAISSAAVEALNEAALNTSIGNLLTDNSQQVADRLVSNAVDIVISLISNITGQLDNLLSAQDHIDSFITILNGGSDSYLNTKYEDAAKDFSTSLLALRGSISTISHAYKIAEVTLKLIENSHNS